MTVSVIGLDISKSVFHLVGLDEQGRTVLRKELKRAKLLEYFAQALIRCVVGMETCGGAHHWARELQALGYPVKLMSPKAVKGYRNKTKNDYNDAQAIAEATPRDNVRAIPVKSVEQQERQAVHRVRALAKKQRNQQASNLRGLLAEYGLAIPKGLRWLHQRVPEVLEDAENGLGEETRELLAAQYQMLCALEKQLLEHNQRLSRVQAADANAKRIAEIPGVGVITSSAVSALHGDLRQFRRGRDFAAALGLVPRQNSTGGRSVLLGINKHTDPYLRTLFIHGARSVLRRAEAQSHDPLSRWAAQLRERRGYNVAAVALANKLARIAWAVLVRGERYDPHKPRPAHA